MLLPIKYEVKKANAFSDRAAPLLQIDQQKGDRRGKYYFSRYAGLWKEYGGGSPGKDDE